MRRLTGVIAVLTLCVAALLTFIGLRFPGDDVTNPLVNKVQSKQQLQVLSDEMVPSRWEYRVQSIPYLTDEQMLDAESPDDLTVWFAEELEQLLTEWGKEGWRLAHVVGGTMIFEREAKAERQLF